MQLDAHYGNGGHLRGHLQRFLVDLGHFPTALVPDPGNRYGDAMKLIQHDGEDGANAGSDDDVKIIGDLRVRIAGLGPNLVLGVDDGGAGSNGGGSNTVHLAYVSEHISSTLLTSSSSVSEQEDSQKF
ncbi:hypothetical protein LR48_Vigan07g248200 [Vigna angularis]|uniref:Uncharacterized protein n=1 Tax=Phaseolus angularis TaxID=3914 RepID=A0A0L9V160_PHAAN|nr:hypothetical protein LR48_Vigan07g248200 [Vigna angularis]